MKTGAVQQHRVVAAVLRRGDRVLLCHRSPARRWFPDVWDFPGGHVENGEAPEQALRRELSEEIGVDIGTVDSDPVVQLSDPGTGLDLSVWLITDWVGSVENRQPSEHDDIGWFGTIELRDLELAHESYLSILERILARRHN
jgi:mutator protein MutT